MTIAARLYVAEVNLRPNDIAEVKLNAVCRGEENATWSKATPAGNFTMMVSNPGAIAEFKRLIGKELAVDMSERDPICSVCKEEVPARDYQKAYDAENDGTYAGGDPDSMGPYVHGKCAEEARNQQKA